jgi:hypothetical protein
MTLHKTQVLGPNAAPMLLVLRGLPPKAKQASTPKLLQLCLLLVDPKGTSFLPFRQKADEQVT